jgi:hypothetical protein
MRLSLIDLDCCWTTLSFNSIEDEINFHVVHRLKPKQDKSPRGIVAKFERRKDRNKALSKAIAKLKIHE